MENKIQVEFTRGEALLVADALKYICSELRDEPNSDNEGRINALTILMGRIVWQVNGK